MSDFNATGEAHSRRQLSLAFTASGSECFRIWMLAHELGQLRQRHGHKMLFKAGAMSALMGLRIGDQ